MAQSDKKTTLNDGGEHKNTHSRNRNENALTTGPKTANALTQQNNTLNDRAKTENAVTQQKINHIERPEGTQKTRTHVTEARAH